MKKRWEWLLFFAAVVVMCLMSALANADALRRAELERILDQEGYEITAQTPVTLELTLDVSDLPKNLDLTRDTEFKENRIVCWKSDTSTVWLRKIYPRADEGQIGLEFDIFYVLPPEGTILFGGEITENNGFRCRLGMESRTVLMDGVPMADAVRFHGSGPGQVFSVLVDEAVFCSAQRTLSFSLDGFYALTYEKHNREPQAERLRLSLTHI